MKTCFRILALLFSVNFAQAQQQTPVKMIAPSTIEGQLPITKNGQVTWVTAPGLALPASPTAVYRLDETSGSVLHDDTGHGNNITITGTAPTLTGQGIVMSAATTALTTPLTGVAKSLMVCFTAPVGALQSSGIGYDFPPVPTLIANSSITGAWLLQGFNQNSTYTQSTRFYMGPTTPIITTYPSGAITPQYISDAGVAGGAHCWVVVRGNSGDVVYQDGGPVTPTANPGTLSFTNTGAAITIGGTTDGNAPTFKWWGTLHSVVLWMNASLTAQQSASAYAWAKSDLGNKGLSINAPPPRPTDGVSRVVAIGDSITGCAGAGGPSNPHCYWSQWSTSGSSYRPLANAQLAANVTAVYDPGGSSYLSSVLGPYREGSLFDCSASNNVAFLYWGTNDLCRNQYSGQQTYNRLRRISRDLRACGVKVVIETVLDIVNANQCGTNNENGSAAKNELNAIIRTNWPKDFDGIADSAAHAMGCDGCSSSGAYYADGVHPNIGGNDVISTYGRNAIDRVTGSTKSSPTAVITSGTTVTNYTMQSKDGYVLVQFPNDFSVSLTTTLTLPTCVGLTGTNYTVASVLRSTDGAVIVQPTSGEEFAGGRANVWVDAGTEVVFTATTVKRSDGFACYWQPSAYGVGPVGTPSAPGQPQVAMVFQGWPNTDRDFLVKYSAGSTYAAGTTLLTLQFGRLWVDSSNNPIQPVCSVNQIAPLTTDFGIKGSSVTGANPNTMTFANTNAALPAGTDLYFLSHCSAPAQR